MPLAFVPAARLEHITPGAVAAIRLGVQDAAVRQASEVGTTHLLGGVVAEGTNLALQVPRAMEIDTEDVVRALDATPPDASEGADDPDGAVDPVPPRFSRTAANALELAVTESTGFGHNYIGCEHLLLGLVDPSCRDRGPGRLRPPHGPDPGPEPDPCPDR